MWKKVSDHIYTAFFREVFFDEELVYEAYTKFLVKLIKETDPAGVTVNDEDSVTLDYDKYSLTVLVPVWEDRITMFVMTKELTKTEILEILDYATELLEQVLETLKPEEVIEHD